VKSEAISAVMGFVEIRIWVYSDTPKDLVLIYIYIHKVAEALQEEYVKITITQVVRNTVYTICLTGLLKLEPGSTTEIVKTTGVGHANHWHTASKRNADYCHNLRRDFILAMV
jgi:hypothetical protein